MQKITYHITEGNECDWGLWAASTPEEAVKLLKDEVSAHPERFCGEPGKVTVTKI